MPELLVDTGNVDFNGSRKRVLIAANRKIRGLEERKYKDFVKPLVRGYNRNRKQIAEQKAILKIHSASRKTRYIMCPLCQGKIFIK